MRIIATYSKSEDAHLPSRRDKDTPEIKMIHIYPGMGANSSMYGKPWKEEILGIYHDWPSWGGETTIAEMAERLIVDHQIKDGDVLIGSSLGGIVAGEIAKQRPLGLCLPH